MDGTSKFKTFKIKCGLTWSTKSLMVDLLTEREPEKKFWVDRKHVGLPIHPISVDFLTLREVGL